MADRSNPAPKKQRIVIKVGSALLFDATSGELRTEWLTSIAEDIKQWRDAGCELVLVSSGAVAFGRQRLAMAGASKPMPSEANLEHKQALAALGQPGLMQGWQQAFEPQSVLAAQVLLSLQDSERRNAYLNARHTLNSLLDNGLLPIINENDTVATDELRVGDNDRLAARVAQMLEAHWLILLSDVDGLYDANPKQHADAARLARVEEITPAIEAMAGGAGTTHGTGGMITKIEAAKIATRSGTSVLIGDGRVMHPLAQLWPAGEGTCFPATTSLQSARKRWISGHLAPQGVLYLDAGAVRALQKGKSLLPAGVVKVEGLFSRGEAVRLIGPDGEEIGRGLVGYGAVEMQQIAGRQSGDIEAILGYTGRSAVVHRDDLVMHAAESAGQQKAAGG